MTRRLMTERKRERERERNISPA